MCIQITNQHLFNYTGPSHRSTVHSCADRNRRSVARPNVLRYRRGQAAIRALQNFPELHILQPQRCWDKQRERAIPLRPTFHHFQAADTQMFDAEHIAVTSPRTEHFLYPKEHAVQKEHLKHRHIWWFDCDSAVPNALLVVFDLFPIQGS